MNRNLLGSVVWLVLAGVILGGCGKETTPAKSVASGEVRYDSLPESAVLIQIGNVRYLKNDLEEEMSLMVALRQLQGTKMDEKQIKSFRRYILPGLYANARKNMLYMADAKSVSVQTDTNMVQKAKSGFLSMAGLKNGKYEDLKGKLATEQVQRMDKLIADDVVIQAYLKKKMVGKDLSATPEELKKAEAGYRRRIAATEEEAKKSWALAKEICAKLDKGANFDDFVDKYSIAKEFDQIGEGDWHVTALNLILDEKLKAEVAKTPVGEHTAPIETSEGIYIVKVLGRTGHGEMSMANMNPERLRLRRIVVRLPMAIEPYDKDVMANEILKLRTSLFQQNLLKALSDKFKVDQPQGTNLWARAVNNPPAK